MIGGLLMIGLGVLWLANAARPQPAAWPWRRSPAWVGAAMIVVGLLAIVLDAQAAPTKPMPATGAPRIPDSSAMYRRWVEQAAVEVWGVDASPARLAAQLHQESSWNPRARSAAGAEGLAQFMPATSRWIAQRFPDRLGDFDPWDPQEAALAAALYDRWLIERNRGANACASWAFGLSAYNGGERWLHDEQALARRAGRDPGLWFDNVALARARSAPAWRENRGYVHRVLLELEPAYIAAGWSGEAVCHA